MRSHQAQVAGQDAGTAGLGASQQGFTQQHTTEYDFNQANVWTTTGDGTIFFGSSTGGDSKTWVMKDTTGKWRKATPAEAHWRNFDSESPDKAYLVPSNGGYIDPNTGKITYATSGSAYEGDSSIAAGIATAGGGGGGGVQTKDYWYAQDYGLGPSSLGIIPIQRDANGTPTKFYAGTAGGGGQVFTDLAKAQASVAAYKTWYDQQHPAGTPGTQIAPTAPAGPAAPAAPTAPGILTTPGSGEGYFDATQGKYTAPTNAQQFYDSTKDIYGRPTNAQAVFDATPNQPTESQQLWNKYSGMYANPNYLDDYYATEQQKTQTALERRAASAGVGDSSSAARAVGGIGLDFAGKKLLAREAFTNTGMGLAGAADSSGIALGTLRGNLAGTADTRNLAQTYTGQIAAGATDAANLAQLSGGQVAANSAENMMINRETGGLASATTLAQDQAALTAAGLDSATSARYLNELQVQQAEWQKAGLTAQQQYQKATELMTSMGIVGNAATSYYLAQKFGQPTTTNPYIAPTTTTTPGTSYA